MDERFSRIKRWHIIGIGLVALAMGLLASGCAPAVSRGAIDIDDVRPGERVLVVTDGGLHVSGRLSRHDSTSLQLAIDDGNREFPVQLDDVRSFERHVRTSGHEVAGTLIGGGVGFVVGALMVATAEVGRVNAEIVSGLSGGEVEQRETDYTPLVITTVVGGVIGYAIGQGGRTEYWQPVRWDNVGVGVETGTEVTRAGVYWNF